MPYSAFFCSRSYNGKTRFSILQFRLGTYTSAHAQTVQNPEGIALPHADLENHQTPVRTLRSAITQYALLALLTLFCITLFCIRRTLRISRIFSAICSTSFGSPSLSTHLALLLATTFVPIQRQWNANLTASSPDFTPSSRIAMLALLPTFRRPRGRAT